MSSPVTAACRETRIAIALSIAWGFAACDAGEPPLASVDAGVVDAAERVARPIPPASPQLGPCPVGWTSREVAPAILVCEPADPTPCGPGEAWRAGGDRCAPIGRACPADGWPTELPTDAARRFVRAGAVGGDGITRETAYGTIAEALAGAAPGTVVLIAAGTYSETLTLRAGVELRGACASETRIGAATPVPATPVVYVGARDVALTDVGIAPVGSIGITVEGGSLRVDGVSIEGATAFGLATLNAEVSGSGLLVRDVSTRSDGTFGSGVAALGTSTLTLADVVVERASGAGLELSGPIEVTLTELAVRDTAPNEGGRNGHGVRVDRAARVELVAADVRGSKQAAVFVRDAQLTVRDSLLRDTESRVSDGSGGAGVFVSEGRVELTRVHIRGSRSGGIYAADGGTLVARDLIIEDTRDRASGAGLGVALVGAPGATLTIERALLVGWVSAGLVAGGGTGRFDDLTILGDATATDATVGLGLGNGGDYSVHRVLIDGATTEGVIVAGSPSTVTIDDLQVRDIRSKSDGTFGRGIELNGGVTLRLTRARVERTREIAVVAIGIDTQLEAVDLAVVDTAERACAEASCVGLGGGIGLGAYDGAHARAERFLVYSSALCGVQLATDGALDLQSGEIRGAVVGACVQVPGYDLTRLTSDVSFDANGVNIETVSLYVPAPTDFSF